MANSPNKIYGIDLGTTNSAIAFVDEYNKPQVIPNSDNERITRSVVFFENPSNIVVGTGAVVAAATEPDREVSFVKRQMGNTQWTCEMDGNIYKPETVCAEIIKRIVKDASQSGEHQVHDVVITVPAYFGDLERQRTRDAGELAGLNVVQILDEPVAAAIYYALNAEAKGKNIIVYDLGGGTFDVTVVSIGGGDSNQEISVVCTDGNHQLGGKDWDDRIIQYLCDKYREETGSEEDILSVPETAFTLRRDVEQSKKLLTRKESVNIAFQHEGQKCKVTVTRTKLDELTADLLEQTLVLTDEVIAVARERGVTSIDTFLLVGGSTRMPQVKEKLIAKYGLTYNNPSLPNDTLIELDVDEAVAKGAAIAGEIHVVTRRVDEEVKKIAGEQGIDSETATPDDKEKLLELATQQVAVEGGLTLEEVRRKPILRVVATKSYGVRALDAGRRPIIANLIAKNTRVPCKQSRVFGTGEADADALDLVVYLNNELSTTASLDSGTVLGEAEFKLDGTLPEGAPIEITFELDEQGCLTMNGLDTTCGRKVSANFRSDGVMSLEEKERVKAELAMQNVS